jgi:hypothetical protein
MAYRSESPRRVVPVGRRVSFRGRILAWSAFAAGLAGVVSALAVTPFIVTRMMVGSERPRPVLRGEPVFEPDDVAVLDPNAADAPAVTLAAVESRIVDPAAVDLGPKVVQTFRVRARAVPAAALGQAAAPAPTPGSQPAAVVVAAAPPAIEPPAGAAPETTPLPPNNPQPAAGPPRADSRGSGPRLASVSTRLVALPRRDDETPRKLFEQVLPSARRADPAADDIVGSITAYNNPDLPGETATRTAVYDIAGHTVHMPNGDKLEAHSGLGTHFDDPRWVNVRMRGATPPNTYSLAMRESPFHGVAAIRMKPVWTGEMFGRDGILAHSYMLGPRGESNGCVSFKDYDRFLAAFRRGEVARMVVVARTAGTPASVAAARRSADVRFAVDKERR